MMKTGCDPMAVKPPSQSVINNRRQSLLAVWKHLGHEGRPDREQAEGMVLTTGLLTTPGWQHHAAPLRLFKDH